MGFSPETVKNVPFFVPKRDNWHFTVKTDYMRNKLVLFALTGLALLACHTSKKTTTSTAEATKTTATTTTVVTTTTVETTAPPIMKARKAFDGIYEPGEEELVAIQSQYKDATLAQLNEGYSLYAKSACISCHTAQNIYVYKEDRWSFILQDMCYKAQLNTSQKEAVTRYVFAIKAADPNKNH